MGIGTDLLTNLCHLHKQGLSTLEKLRHFDKFCFTLRTGDANFPLPLWNTQAGLAIGTTVKAIVFGVLLPLDQTPIKPLNGAEKSQKLLIFRIAL